MVRGVNNNTGTSIPVAPIANTQNAGEVITDTGVRASDVIEPEKVVVQRAPVRQPVNDVPAQRFPQDAINRSLSILGGANRPQPTMAPANSFQQFTQAQQVQEPASGIPATSVPISMPRVASQAASQSGLADAAKLANGTSQPQAAETQPIAQQPSNQPDVNDYDELEVMSRSSEAIPTGSDYVSNPLIVDKLNSVKSPNPEGRKPEAQADKHDDDASAKTTSNRGIREGIKDLFGNVVVGYSPRMREQYRSGSRQAPVLRASAAAKAFKKLQAQLFSNKGVGHRIYGKMAPLVSLSLRDVGVGWGMLQSVLEQNTGMLDRLLVEQGVLEQGESVSGMEIVSVMNLINSSEVYVAAMKAPNNEGSDVQRRRLRVLTNERDGIYIHPIMAPTYNADFDGDDMEISLNPETARMALDPMDCLVNFGGALKMDNKFLPVSRIVDGWKGEGEGTVREYVTEMILRDWSGVDDRHLRPIVDAIIELSERWNQGSDRQAEAWVSLISAIRGYYNGSVKDDNEAMSKMIGSIYHHMQILRVDNTLATIGRVIDFPVEPKNKYDHAYYHLVDTFLSGNAPVNFQEFKIAMNGFLGMTEGTNAPFRFSADVGKLAKMDPRMRVGNEYVVKSDKDIESLFKSTMQFAQSSRMTHEIKKAGRAQAYTDMLRERVRHDVKFPEKYNDFAEFIAAFVDSYDRHSARINEANRILYSNNEISDMSKGTAVAALKATGTNGAFTYSDIAEAFLTIYGDYSLDRMFLGLELRAGSEMDPFYEGNPNHATGRSVKLHSIENEGGWYNDQDGLMRYWVAAKYGSLSLRYFSKNNHVVWNKKRTESQIRSNIMNARNAAEIQYNLMLAIADKRTSSASEFNGKMYGFNADKVEAVTEYKGKKTTLAMMRDNLSEIAALSKANEETRMSWVDDVVRLLVLSGTEMFSHFNMDSTAGFLKSKFGDLLIRNRDDIDMLGGIRTAMVIDMRMDAITRADSDVTRAAEANDVDDLQRCINRREFAWQELRDSSEVWHAIYKEVHTSPDQSAFKLLHDRRMAEINGTATSSLKLCAPSYWETHDSGDIIEFLSDTNIGMNEKWNVLTDIVRLHENDPFLNSYEIGFQLENQSTTSWALDAAGAKSVLGSYNDYASANASYANIGYANMVEDANSAADLYDNDENRGTLMRALGRMASNPWEQMRVHDDVFNDAIMSVYDKDYAQTEKAKQHPWTSYLYSSLSFQRNDGMYNDVYRTNDRVLGMLSVNDVTERDIITILSDGDAMLTVYDDRGDIAFVTRNSVMGLAPDANPTEHDIWEFLRREPRIASALRQTGVFSSNDGDGWVGASSSILETVGMMGATDNPVSPIEHVKYLMRDHPVYAGIVALATPMARTSARMGRNRVKSVDAVVLRGIYEYAKDANVRSHDAAVDILNSIGITRIAVRNAMARDNYDKWLDMMEVASSRRGLLRNLEARMEADKIYDTCVQYMERYILEVRDNVDMTVEIDDEFPRVSYIGVDVTSCAAFWDVVQELSGAKTEVSTGVEGAETYQFAEWVSHYNTKDSYANLAAIIDKVDESFNGMWTNCGQLSVVMTNDGRLQTNYDELRNYARANHIDEIVTRVPQEFTVPDHTVTRTGFQMPSLYAYMVSKRSNGAETYNLKAKKTGLDGTDSITKMNGKYRVMPDGKPISYVDLYVHYSKIMQEEGIEAARLALAKELMNSNKALGYKDLTLANYMSIAEIMLVQGDDGTIRLRSLNQLLSAARSSVGIEGDEMNEKELTERITNQINDVSDAGVGALTHMIPDAIEAFDKLRPRKNGSSFRSVRNSSSNLSRNLELIDQITRRTGNQVIDDARAKQFSMQAVGDGRDPEYSKAPGVDGIANVYWRSMTLSNYNVIGYAGSTDGTNDKLTYSVGPSAMFVVGDGEVTDEQLVEIIGQCNSNGMTLLVSANNVPLLAKYRCFADAIPCNDYGDVIVPFFDMRLNRMSNAAHDLRWSTFQVSDYGNYVITYEDSVNEYECGDAQYKPFANLIKRLKYHDSDNMQINMASLFPNVVGNDAYDGMLTRFRIAAGRDVEAMIINNGLFPTVDYGLPMGAKGFNQLKHDVDKAIDRYRDRWMKFGNEYDGRDVVSDDLRPGDIVAWAQCEIIDPNTNATSYVYAPIIPFPLHGTKQNIPANFKMNKIARSASQYGATLQLDWENSSSLLGRLVKYFDSSGGANKGMVSISDMIDGQDMILMDGTAIDAVCASQSTESRKIGLSKRIKTMSTLMTIARMHGYNFANVDGAFPVDENHPENEEIRERLATIATTDADGQYVHGLSRSDWKRYFGKSDWNARNFTQGGREVLFCADQQVNLFLNYECRKVLANGGNPTDYLTNMMTDGEEREFNTHVMWEFECMFESSLAYEDSLLKYMHMLNPQLCPNGIDDMTEETWFRVYRDENNNAEGYDRGVLQMLVPHHDLKGNKIGLWQNVYAGMSFFGEDYTGSSRANIEGADNMLDAANTVSMYGRQQRGQSARRRFLWSTSAYGRPPKDGGAFG